MRKICFVCFLLLSTIFILTSCSCEHEWVNATCTAPVTCSKCGETAGDPLNHNWQEATCTTPKTCSVCDVTEGKEVGHTWANATCTTPKTCSICGTTDGTEVGHTWTNAACTTPKTCSVCSVTEGEEVGHTWVNATCTTPKTCSVCGVTEGAEGGHAWINATCTTPKTCSVCGVTEGTVGGHNWHDATCTEPQTCYTCWATQGSALGHSDDGSGWCSICWEQLYVIEPTITASGTSLQLGETSQVIYFTMTGADTIVYDIDNTNVVYCEWGEWDGDTIPLTFYPVASGQTYVTVYPEGANKSVTINVSVKMSTPSDLTTLTIEGIGNQFYQYINGKSNTHKLHSATYEIKPYVDDDIAIWVDYIVSCTECNVNNGYIRIRYNLYNSNGVVVDTGETINEFTHTNTQYAGTLVFSDLPADDYRLVFSNDSIAENSNGNQDVSTGQVKGQITWQYNKFIGTSGDNGAKVLIIPANDSVKSFDNHEAAMFLTGTYDSGIMVTKCDGYGNFDFGDVPAGKYILLVVSKNTNSMERYIDESSWISNFKMCYGDSFSDEDMNQLIMFVGYQKYAYDYITVEKNKIIKISHDFGYTDA